LDCSIEYKPKKARNFDDLHRRFGKSTGRKLVIGSRLIANGAPVIWFERCRAGTAY
jgi:hypothetical protein